MKRRRVRRGSRVVCQPLHPITGEPDGPEFLAAVLEVEGKHYIVRPDGGPPHDTPLYRSEIKEVLS